MKRLFLVFLVMFSSITFANPSWEIIKTPEDSASIMRLSVPQGWLVSYKEFARGITFIPDGTHTWKMQDSVILDSKDIYLKKSDVLFLLMMSFWLNAGISFMICSFFRK